MPLWLFRGARVAVGRALASCLPLLLTPFPPVWLAVQPPPSATPPPTSPTIVRHICFLLTPGKRGEKKKKEKQRNVELPPGLGPASQTGHMEWSRGQAWGGGPGLVA